MVRAVVVLVLVGLVGWGAYARLSADDPEPPAAAPPTPSATNDPSPVRVSEGPPLFVRYPNPLEGSWTADSGRLTLVVSNSRLTLTDFTHYRSLRFIRVEGHRVYVRPSGIDSDSELATYRWRIHGDRLTFLLLERTPKAALRLEELPFRRRA